MMIQAYRDLEVWQKAMSLVVEIYKLTEQFPKEEVFGLASQMRRAGVSIPSNIAEGRYRSTRKDFAQFLSIAYGSGAELETQVELVKRLPKTNNLDYGTIDKLLTEIMKMLNVMIKHLKYPTKPIPTVSHNP